MHAWIALALLTACPPRDRLTESDHDGDGWPNADSESFLTDCDDEDPEVHPGALDPRGDGCDSDCGLVPDQDGDDWPDAEDCAPEDANAFPCSAAETDGDGIDQDCDGADGMRTEPCDDHDPRFPDAEPDDFPSCTP